MKLEDIKNKKPLTVPDGYFENLDSNIMRMLPQKPVATPQKRRTVNLTGYLRYTSYAAATLLIFFIGSTLFKSHNSNIANNEEYYTGEYIDEMLTSYPIDDYTFYCYVTENN